ncbi:hypothetical protein FZW96_06900 [Bacillus sp. BGMRC 2118]|nr:hypothetical protein FZW96_06900 [Bacillus sp. BGMRC 2118]
MEWLLSQKWLIFVEILIVSFGLYRVVNIIREYKNQDASLTFHDKIEKVIAAKIKKKFLRSMVTREILIFFYLFSKTRQTDSTSEHTFTFHKDSSYVAFQIAILSALVLEGVGFSFLLHNWKPWVAWLHTILSVYAIIFLISDIKAVMRNPLKLQDNKIMIRLGFRYKLDIPIANIKTIQDGKINYEHDKKKKDRYTVALLELEEPHFEIILHEPLVIVDSLGRKREILHIFLSIDNKDRFYRELRMSN